MKIFCHLELALVESTGNGGYLLSLVEIVVDFTITQYIPTKTQSM
ncbi:MAG: hypothetical protein ACRC5R_05790 [Mycoplasmatales bacterium]